jgi:GxxExxY protein
MPVFIKGKIKKVSQKEFYLIDEEIMKYVFELHNDLGRFCNETIYHHELNFMAKRKGFSTQNEVEICIRHKDFFKKYYIDLLINNSCIYEIKTVDKLSGIHRLIY